MSDDRDVRAGLGVTHDSAEMKQVADDVRTIGDSLLDAGDAAKQATLDFEGFGAARLASGGALATPGAMPDADGGGGGGRRGRGGGAGFGKGRAGLASLSRASSILGGEAGAAGQQVFGLASQTVGLASNMGPLGLAIVGVTAVLGHQAAANKELEEETRRAIEADRALAEAHQKTTTQIEDEINAIERKLEIENEVLSATEERSAGLEDERDRLDKAGNVFLGFGGIILGLGDDVRKLGQEFGIWGGDIEAVDDALDEQTKTVEDLEAEHKALTEALESEEVAANDASSALLDRVDQIGEVRKFEQEALDGSAEDNQRRAEAIADERKIIQEQIDEIKRSGIASDESQARLEELNSELDTLSQQSDILSSAAVQAAESQKELAQATEELAKEAEASAKAAGAASKKTASTRVKEREAINESIKAQNEVRDDELELEAEHQKELTELRDEAHEDEIEARQEFGEDIEDLVKNQSFLAAIDEQDAFVKTEKKRKAAASEALIALQLELAEERILEEIAGQELLADKDAAIAKESALVRDAEREEIKLKSEAARDVVELERNRAEQEVDLHAQLNQNIVDMLANVVEFSGDAATEVNRRLSSIDTTSNGKKGKRGRTRVQAMQDMINEVIRPT